MVNYIAYIEDSRNRRHYLVYCNNYKGTIEYFFINYFPNCFSSNSIFHSLSEIKKALKLIKNKNMFKDYKVHFITTNAMNDYEMQYKNKSVYEWDITEEIK